ncbi:hypothetical protein [Nakamurella sp.]|uniref:hypothetical protein n=1 Tax=Nakamurella sp. TaxID=1869182 RepID=UPI003B3B1E95
MKPVPARIVIPDLEGSIVAGALHQADLIGFTLVIADPPADLASLQMSGRWVVAAQEPPGGSSRFRGDTVVITLRRDGGDGAGDREPRVPVPPRLAERAPLEQAPPAPAGGSGPAAGRGRDDLPREATVLRFERPPAGR